MVYIIGAGDQGRLALDYFRLLDIPVEGFFDDFSSGIVEGVKILGRVNEIADIVGDLKSKFHIAIGNLKFRKKIKELLGKDYQFPNLIHPNTIISSTAFIPENCGIFVGPGAIINTRAEIDPFAIINTGVIVEHDVRIGEFSTIQPGVIIAGAAKIGRETMVGMGALVLDHCNIGNNCIIGAGAVITKDFPDNTKVMGVPGRIREKM